MQEEAAGCIFALFRFQHHTLALNLNAAAPLSPIIHNRESRSPVEEIQFTAPYEGPEQRTPVRQRRSELGPRGGGGGGTEARGVGEDPRVAPAPRNSHVC